MNGNVIQAQIIKSKQRVQMKVSQPTKDTEIDPKKIKEFLQEVDLDSQYYTNPTLLYLSSLEYFRIMGKELTFNYENAKEWIQSNQLIENTYGLKWIYEVSSEDDREQITIFFNPNDDPLKKIIQLNIVLEQKKQIPISNLVEIVSDNNEILYGLSLYILKGIETENISVFVPLVQEMIQKCNNTAIHQLIIIELVDKVLSKFSEQAIELINQFGINEQIIQQVEWEEDYKSYTLQELENPYFYLRKTKQLYQYTKEQYEMITNKFRRQWEEKLTEISAKLLLEKKKSDIIHIEDMFKVDPQIELEENPIKEIYTSTRRKTRVLHRQIQPGQPNASQEIDQSLCLQNSTNLLSSQVIQVGPSIGFAPPLPIAKGAPPPPPPLPPKSKTGIVPPPPSKVPPSSDAKASQKLTNTETQPQPIQATTALMYKKYPCTLIQNNIDGTIWKAPLQNKNFFIKEELTKLFIMKAKQQQITKPEKQVTQKEVVEYGASDLPPNQLGIEILMNQLKKPNLEEILEQINQLEFLSKNQDKQVRIIIDNLKIAIDMVQNSNVTLIYYKIKKAKEDSQKYVKQKLEEEDQLQKQELERFQSLSIQEKQLAILELEKNLNSLQNELQDVHGEQEIQQIVSGLEPKLEQFRKDINITQVDEQNSEILFQFESVLLEKNKLLKSKRLRSQDKFQINKIDNFFIKLYDRNPRKGIQIEFFYKEHLDRKIHIENTVTQYSEVFEQLKKDEELIMYFQYIKEYGKVFNDIKDNQFGFKFENMVDFSYKTQQLEGNQEELIKYIVELMMDQGIPFKELEHTPFKHLSILSKPNNDLREILKIIEMYKDHLIFLEENLKVLSQDEKNNDFIQKAQIYAQEYKDYIFQMDTIYKEDQKTYQQIRHFLCDDRENVGSPQFFEDILSIKTQLRFYYNKIYQKRRQQVLDLARSRRI